MSHQRRQHRLRTGGTPNSRARMEPCEPRCLLSTSVLTYHNNSSLTAANLTETQLTLDNVNSNSFGKLRSLQVDGQIYAQPLYVPGLRFNKHGRIVKRNMVYIATQNDTVYGYDADRGSLIWHVAAYNKAMG